MRRVTQFTYTVLGQPYRTYNAAIQAGPLLEQAWTADGLPASLKDANGNTTTFAYDRFDRPVTTTYPGGSTETATYDANSRQLTRTTRAGATIRYGYDTLNRLISKTAAASPVACSAAPSATPTVTYSYDLAGRMTGVCDNSASIAAAAPTSTVYSTAYTYDPLNQPDGVSFDPVPTPTLPAAGSSSTFSFAYNPANQRAAFASTDNAWIDYQAGPASTTAYTANNLNQYTAVGGVTPTYDGNGNLTSDGTFTFGYDAENRLVSASKVGTSAAYAFDAQGRRKRKSVTTGSTTSTVFVTDSENREVLEYDGSTGAILRWYAYGLGPNDVVSQANVSAGSRLTPLPDLLGSIVALVDASTGTITKYGYKPYGTSSSQPDQFAFTGQRVDVETNGLYYYRARHYSPTLGRFTQPDPIGYTAGMNIYAYTNNDPINATDPAGLDSQISLGAQVTAAALVGVGFTLSVGINIPDNPWNVMGYGAVVSGQANWMAGGGIFLGAGTSIGLAHTPGPVTTGLSTSKGWYMEAGLGWGGSIGVSAQGPGELFTREMGMPNGFSVSVSPGVGAGAYVGYGGQAGFSLAGTIGSLASVLSGVDRGTGALSPFSSNYFSQAAQASGNSEFSSRQPRIFGDTSVGFSNSLAASKTWK